MKPKLFIIIYVAIVLLPMIVDTFFYDLGGVNGY